MGLTIGGRGDHYAGYIHLGRDAAGPRAYGALYYNGGHHYRGSYRYHGGTPYYYSGYRPLRYYGCRDYVPSYGYYYASVYYPYSYPYVYHFRDPDVYYVERIYEGTDGYDGVGESSVGVGVGPPARSLDYPMLTEPSGATPVGRGNAAFTAGRYEEARSEYISAVLADERDGYAKFLYALANLALGEYDVAAVALRRALHTTPELLEYPVDVRSLYPDGSVFERQVASLAAFVRTRPTDWGARLLLGYLYYGGGEPEQAFAVLDAGAEIAPEDTAMALLRDAVVRVIEGRGPGE